MVQALVLERQKRSTAGTRMSALVGQAAKDDEEFWSHSTWAEEKGDLSDDGSFHESDEGSDAGVDVFDSDFDDSEAEEGGDEGQMENNEEEESLLREERREKRAVSKRKRMDLEITAGYGKEYRMLQKRNDAVQKKLKARRIDEDKNGHSSVTGVESSAGLSTAPSSVVDDEGLTTEQKRTSSRNKSIKYNASDLVGKRSLRTSTINSSIATSAAEISRQQQQHQQQQSQSTTTGRLRQKQKFTQEELLMEAVSKTEPENQRWLLHRKRLQVEQDFQADIVQKMDRLIAGNKKVISQFHSKRGCLNTLTFPEMDHVPEIFTRGRMTQEQRQRMLEQKRKENTCVITGKKAKYRDPKTNLGYHDLAAFKELRRRFEAGEDLDRLASTKNLGMCPDGEKISQAIPLDACPQPQPQTHQLQLGSTPKPQQTQQLKQQQQPISCEFKADPICVSSIDTNGPISILEVDPPKTGQSLKDATAENGSNSKENADNLLHANIIHTKTLIPEKVLSDYEIKKNQDGNNQLLIQKGTETETLNDASSNMEKNENERNPQPFLQGTETLNDSSSNVEMCPNHLNARLLLHQGKEAVKDATSTHVAIASNVASPDAQPETSF